VKVLFCVLLLTVFILPVSGQEASQPWLTQEDQVQVDTLRRSGIEALYNLDYDKAQKNFKEITSRYPNHPAGYQLQAAGVWAKTLYESRRLQGSLYSSESFYKTGDDNVDPKIVKEFRNLTREAKRL
jgi:outer membrane protein assembly factor BamD (BamD/ComL family)